MTIGQLQIMQSELQSAIITDPLVVSVDTTVQAALAQMSGIRSTCAQVQGSENYLDDIYIGARSSCVIVVDAEQIVGIFTEQDVVRLSAAQQHLAELPIGAVMAQPVITLRQADYSDLITAINLLQRYRIRHLPVVDDRDRLVGLITHESLRQLTRPIHLLRLRSAADVMMRTVICAAPTDSVLSVARQMAEHQISSIVIVDVDLYSSRALPIGLLTERDLVQFQALQLNFETTLAQAVMSTPLFTVRPDESLWAVQQLMDRQRIRRVVITGDRGELLGLVTQSSVLHAFNPLELYKLAEVLEDKVVQLESEKVTLLEKKSSDLEQLLERRTEAIRKRAEHETLLAQLATQIRASLNLQSILDTTVQRVRQILGCDRATIWRFKPDWTAVVVAEATILPHSILGEEILDTCIKTTQAEVYRRGRVRVVNDINNETMTDCHREMLQRLHTRAKILVPLMCGKDIWGLLNVIESEQPREWHPDEVELLEALAVHLAVALQQSMLHQQLSSELAARKRSEAQLQQLASNLPDSIFLYTYVLRPDGSHGFSYLSPRAAAIFELPLEVMLANPEAMFEQCHPDDLAVYRATLTRSLATLTPFQCEWRTLSPVGKTRWLQAKSTPKILASGEVIWTGMAQDISDRKEAELAIAHLNAELEERVVRRTRALEERQARYQALMEGASDAIILSTQAGQIIEANRQAAALLGYSTAELATLHFSDLHHPADAARISQAFAQLANQAVFKIADITFRSRSGEAIPVDATASVIDIAGERIVQGLFRDVRDRKAAELALRQSEAKFRQIVTTANEGICVIDNQGKTVFCNAALIRMLGATVGAMQARSVYDFVAPEAHNYLQERLRQRRTGLSEQYELPLLRDDHSIMWGLISASPVTDEQGQAVGAMALITDITARKQFETQLRKNETHLTTAQRIGKFGSWEYDLATDQITWSQEVFRIFDSFTGTQAPSFEDFVRIICDRDRPQLLRAIRETIATAEPYEIECSFYRSDGSIGHFFTRGEPVKDASNHVVQLIGTVLDVSARKEAELALQAKTDELDRFFSLSIDLLFIGSSDGRILRLNHQWETLLGYPLDVLEGSHFIDYIHPDDHEKTLTAAAFLVDGKPVPDFSNRFRCQDGSYRWLDWRAVTSGNLVFAVARDVTARILAEQENQQRAERETLLREITQHIRESLDLQTIFDTACKEIRIVLDADRVGVFRFDPDSGWDTGEFVAESVVPPYPSALAAHIFDHCFGEKYAPLYAQGRYAAMADIAQLDDCHTDVLAKFEVKANLVMPLICADQLWGLLCVHQCQAPRHWLSQEIEFTQQLANQLAIAIQQADLYKQGQQELLERQQAEQQLTERNQQLALSLEELARATRLKDEFLANMSHELRTPLNAILGMTEALQEQTFGSITPKQQKALDIVERSGSHLLALINDILDTAKIESGQLELELASTSMNLLAESSLAFIKQLALKKQITITTYVPDSLPDILVDERRLRQALINLLSNAVKFTRESGSITLTIAPFVESGQRYMRFSVSDTGIGIAPNQIPKLFQPFVQIDSALNRQYSGTGLGLSLVKRIAELHGGTVGLTSEVGVGSCFMIDIPFQATPVSQANPACYSDYQASVQFETSLVKPKIVLAEDNEDIIITISSYLEAKGFCVVSAKNGNDVIRIIESEKPNVVLMDIRMPGMDGLEAMQYLRNTLGLVDLPIIALTALAMEGDRERCLEAGATEYLSKPVQLKALVALIHRLVTPSQNEQ